MGNYGSTKMISVDYNLEKQFLSNLQSLSERISDLVNKGDFSQIEILDKERQIIIKSFTHELSDKSKRSLIKILEQNRDLIKQIEIEKSKLSSNYNKILNIFNAYK
jgi:predicted regulator of Ras-like GTPase activity (Roadblock/LC7/MglB family)